jgi:hypothetical protein
MILLLSRRDKSFFHYKSDPIIGSSSIVAEPAFTRLSHTHEVRSRPHIAAVSSRIHVNEG